MVARIVATIRIILSLSREGEKSENPVHMKTKTLSLVLIPVLAYFSALPTSQAVSPPPDGGYPGGNIAEGHALLSLTAGTYNTAAGCFSLQSNLIGDFNARLELPDPRPYDRAEKEQELKATFHESQWQ